MYNKVFMVGEVCSPVHTKQIESTGKTVGNFRIKTSDKNTQYHTVNVYDTTAEMVKDYSEGTLVFLEGKMCTRSYLDRNGDKKWVTTVNAHRCHNICVEQCPMGEVCNDKTENKKDLRTEVKSDDITAEDMPF